MSDTTPPALSSISLSAATLNIGAGQTSLIVTAHLTDDLSGIFDGTYADGSGGSSPQVRFVSPSGQFVDGVFDILHPLSGNRLDGVYQARITLPSTAEAGIWQAQYLLLNDEAGNTRTLSPTNSAAVATLSFSVTNSASDVTPPTLASVNLSTSSLNIGAGQTSLIVTAHLTDDLSGIFDGTYADGSGGSSPQVRFVSPSGQFVDGVFDILHPLSGNRLDGYYQARITLDSAAEAGLWQVQYLLLNDEAGNAVSLYPANSPALAALSFSVINGASTPPTISMAAIASNYILNPAEAQQPLAVTGTSTGAVGQTVTVALNGAQYTGTVASDGTWSVTVPQSALLSSALPDGTYTVTADVSDQYGNAAQEATQTLTVQTGPTVTSALDYTPFNDPSAGAGPNQFTDPTGINDLGQIVGNYIDSSGVNHPFLYSDGNFTTLPNVPGASFTQLNGINNSGQIVALAQESSGLSGFLYSGGTYTPFNDPSAGTGPNQFTDPTGINDLGQIVGNYIDSSGVNHPFLYSDGNFTTLPNVPGASFTQLNQQGSSPGSAGEAAKV